MSFAGVRLSPDNLCNVDICNRFKRSQTNLTLRSLIFIQTVLMNNTTTVNTVPWRVERSERG